MNKYEIQAVKEASAALSEIENRLLELVYLKTIAKGKSISVTEEVRIESSEYQIHFGCSKEVAWVELKQSTNMLFERAICFTQTSPDGSTEFVKSRWVGQVGFSSDRTYVVLLFAPLIANTSKAQIFYTTTKTIENI